MANLTTLKELHQNISVLANVEESDSPFFSFYMNMESNSKSWRSTIDERAKLLRRVLKSDQLIAFEESLEKVKQWIANELSADAKGVAIYARGNNDDQFFLPMQFAAPLPTLLAVYPTPNIYHLVELKDSYHRYIVLLSLPERSAIFEVNLGAATTKAWLEHPEVRERVGSEWTRSHYQNRSAERGIKYIRENVLILEKLMRASGQTHLLLAGDPRLTGHVLRALPHELQEKLVDSIPANKRDRHEDVVLATLASFIEHEERESLEVADALVEGIKAQSLAVAGTAASLAALQWGDVDTLVMHTDYEPEVGWKCTECNVHGYSTPASTACLRCSANSVRPLDVKEALVKLAERSNVTVEVVENSNALLSIGGVGCLLRQGSNDMEMSEELAPSPAAELEIDTARSNGVPVIPRAFQAYRIAG